MDNPLNVTRLLSRKPTLSVWQDPPDKIADLQTTMEPPKEAAVVIIGSGISGATIAWNILKRELGISVVMLEARQACSGATGRNGEYPSSTSSIYIL